MKLLPPAITLPAPFQTWLEHAAAEFIQPQSGPAMDFAAPPGEPALVGPDSVSWQVFKNPLPLFIGGVAAVLLEFAEPRICTGVWRHTTFRDEPLRRMQRTGLAAMMTVYGPRTRTEAMIARVGELHRRIHGVTPGGQPYRADDPELLTWVQATASFGFLEAYHAYVRPLGPAQRDRYYAESQASARLYGATGAPLSQRELDLLFASMRDKLERSPIVFEFLDIMYRAPLLPSALRPMQAWLVDAAVGLVPQWVRERLALAPRGSRWQRDALRWAGAAADRIVLRSGPAVQACRRLGLPDDYLYAKASLDHG